MKVTALDTAEYNPFYQRYISKIPQEKSLGDLLLKSKKEVLQLMEELKKEDLGFSYAEGKWTVAEVLVHLMDVERIFQYRALCISRNDKTALPGFDHDSYVEYSEAGNRSLQELKEEFTAVRNATIALYDGFSEAMLQRKGTMNNAPATPRAIGFIVVGHTMHHLEILKERYMT